jgi:UDP-N-acetylglucosamine--N-acetylmuramyl-(pentapeptide) pyrophosphoryl-undecaprenol N-acetylglucosamine transferase
MRHGAAVCVQSSDASAELLTREIDAVLSDPERLQRMARAAAELGRPDAAETVAHDLLDLGNVQDSDDDLDDDHDSSPGDCSPVPSEVH